MSNTPLILNGKELAELEKERIKREVELMKSRDNFTPGLAVIRVGEDPASVTYVVSKEKDCQSVGINSRVVILPESIGEEVLLQKIEELNRDASMHGILVQLPVPKHIDENKVIEAILPSKDADCFHPYNFGKLFSGDSVIEPCTPKGVIKILEHYQIDIAGKDAVVIGRSNIVGKPVAMLLMQKNATVTICHSKTKNLGEVVKKADIVVAAIGKAGFVTGDMVKEGAVIIDVGINRIPDGSKKSGFRLVGDVDFESVSQKASAITPVPNGVGPMTRAMLLDNTLFLARKAYEK